MKKPFAILRLEKRKNVGAITRSSNHNLRQGPLTPNINPEGPAPTLLAGEADVRALLAARTPGKRRKDAVLAIEFVLTASPDWFKTATPEAYSSWKAKNVEFIKAELGDNFINAILHEDETSPHIHVYSSCIVDGKLCYSKMYGTPASLSKLQTRYAQAMKPFGLRRGVEKSTARHTEIKAMAESIEALRGGLNAVLEGLTDLADHITSLEGLEALKGVRDRAAEAAFGKPLGREAAWERDAASGGGGPLPQGPFQKAAPRVPALRC